jgi:hypothetical protein
VSAAVPPNQRLTPAIELIYRVAIATRFPLVSKKPRQQIRQPVSGKYYPPISNAASH